MQVESHHPETSPADATVEARRERRRRRSAAVVEGPGSGVIFLSGEAEQATVERALALGALAYLTKPFDPRGLAASVVRYGH